MISDHYYLDQALSLAAKGQYNTPPNPKVGCVLVKHGRIIGTGFHEYAGGPHAEINALNDAHHQGMDTKGATAYLTLEPCNHHGKTPPCSLALANAGIQRAVIVSPDPNPQARGGGAFLQDYGIIVDYVSDPLLIDRSERINRGFFSRIRQQRPHITLKTAMSLDGRIALASGESQWITGDAARQDAQRLRAGMSAIITGSGTVLVDNPRYTVRPSAVLGDQPRQPLRVIIDTKARLHPDLALFRTGGEVLIITAPAQLEIVQSKFQSNLESSENATAHPSVHVRAVKCHNERADLPSLLHLLATEFYCNDVLVEAGARLSGAFLAAGLIDELIIYQAPTILGHTAKSGFYATLDKLSDQHRLQVSDRRMIGNDWRITATLLPSQNT